MSPKALLTEHQQKMSLWAIFVGLMTAGLFAGKIDGLMWADALRWSFQFLILAMAGQKSARLLADAFVKKG